MNPNRIVNASETCPGKRVSSISLLKRSLVSASIAVASVTLLSSTGAAETLFSDNFTGMSTDTHQSSQDLNDGGWYFTGSDGGTPFRIGMDNTSPLSGNAMQNYGSSGGWTYALKQFPAVALRKVGDSITLSMHYHPDVDSKGYLYVGLLNSAKKVTNDQFGGTSPIEDANGYGVVYATQSGLAGPPTIMKAEGDCALQKGMALETGDANVNLGSSATAHTLSLTLLKVETGTQISWTVDGKKTVATDSIYDTFNTVRLACPPEGSNVYMDNISVTTSVPKQ